MNIISILIFIEVVLIGSLLLALLSFIFLLIMGYIDLR
jgi:hypothetical protein